MNIADESVTGSWYQYEPYPCTVIRNSGGAEIYTVDIEGGLSNVTSISILSHNWSGWLSGAKVSVSGQQCGELGTSDKGTWQEFQCSPGT